MCNFKCFACVPPPMGERARVMLLWTQAVALVLACCQVCRKDGMLGWLW